jgi:hypothetical protein
VLTGPWKFHPGDEASWASPAFDDSSWSTMDLTPPSGSYDPITGSSGFVPGWTARGFPKLDRYAWYRIRVNVESDAAGGSGTALALTMPLNWLRGIRRRPEDRRIRPAFFRACAVLQLAAARVFVA